MSDALLIILSVASVVGLYAYLIYFLVKIVPERRRKRSLDSQWKLPDHKLLKLISESPDGLLSASNLAKLLGVTKKEAKANLSLMLHHKILKLQIGKSWYYELRQPLAEGPFPKLSEKPFLSLGDLMLLFKHFNYRLSLQDLCLATKLPIGFLEEELNYFMKENIVEKLRDFKNTTVSYILKEPYRDNPEDYINDEGRINNDLEGLYHKSELKIREI